MNGSREGLVTGGSGFSVPDSVQDGPEAVWASGVVADAGGLPRHGIGPQGPGHDRHIPCEAVVVAGRPIPFHHRVRFRHGRRRLGCGTLFRRGRWLSRRAVFRGGGRR